MPVEDSKIVTAPAEISKATSMVEAFMRGEEGDKRLLPPVILQYWHTVLRWRLALIAIIATSLALGVLVTFLTAPLYTAKAQIEISRQQKKITNVTSLDTETGTGDQEFYATQYNLLKAQSLAKRIIKVLKLTDRPEFFAAHGEKTPTDADERSRLAAEILLDNVSIDPIRLSRLVNISYTSRSPALSAEISNAWVLEFMGATTDREYQSTAQARTFLEGRLGALRVKMEQSEQNAVNFASERNIVALETTRTADGKSTTQKTLTATDLAALNTALLAARTERIAAQSRASSGQAGVSIELLNNGSIGAIKQHRAQIAGEYAKMLSQFEPEYPAARALKTQIDELDAAIATESARFGAERRQALREAQAREQNLQAQVDAAKTKLDTQSRASIQYNIYQRDADTTRELYDGLLQRYKEIADAGNVGASNIAIVDIAEAPKLPSSPKILVNLALSLLIGLALSAVAVVALEQIDEGIRSPSDVWNLLKLPLLGNVPMAAGDIRESLDDPKSILMEAYLAIRSNLAFSTTHGFPRSLMVTSTQPAEGKSTTALAISEIIGRTGKTVILVEADLRSPSVHKLTKLPNASGASNLLTGDDDLAAHIQATGRPGLSALTSGPLPPNPAELLSNDRFRIIVGRLLEQFDYVIVDAPPVLGLADSPLVCGMVEGTVFVAQPGRAPLRGIRTALQRLKLVGANIYGVIITKIDINQQHYGYSYGYGYGYGYEYGNKDGE